MDSVHITAKHPFKQASKETRQLAEMRWETFPLWGIHRSPGARPLVSGTAAAAHHAVPTCSTLTLCKTAMLTAAPALPQTSGGAGTGPGHVWTPLCVHKGHGDQVQSHPYSQPAWEQRNPPLQKELQSCLPVRDETKHKYYRWGGERMTPPAFSAASVAQYMAPPAWWCFQDLLYTGQRTPETAVPQHCNRMSL